MSSILENASTRIFAASSFVALAFAAFGICAKAADDRGGYSVRGIGTMSCAEVVAKANANAPELVALVAWSDGMVSAANRYEAETFDGVPFTEPPGVFANLVVNFCAKNPQLVYDTAVRQVLNILKPVRIRHSGERQVAKAGAASVSIHPETLKLVEDKLVKLRLLASSGGGYTDAVRDGLLKFQKANKLPETGVPDAQTVFPLLLK